MTAEVELVVAAIEASSAGVRSLVLRSPGGAHLPPFVPGSHLVMRCGGRANAYSLTSDGVDPVEYRVSILKVTGGAGGSRWVHESLAVGDTVSVLPPRSAFAPVARATRHLLIAGGIGVTPILSHLRAARRWRRDVHVIYGHSGNGAHIDDVRELTGGAAEIVTGRAALVSRVAAALAAQPLGTHLYVCGPAGLTGYVLETAAALGWPRSRLHAERFGMDALDPGDPFDVSLTASGRRLTVPGGVSLLEALESEGIAIPNLCRQGVCGECRIPVTGGVPLHRDLFLSDEEKQAGDALMACVSRSTGTTLEVPL